MRLHLAQLCVLVTFLALGGCAQVAPHAYLPPAAKTQVASTEVVLPIRQSEIYVFVPMETAGAGFGLIGALVDVSVDGVRASKAETAVKPLRDAIVDYEFDASLRDELKTALAGASWMGANDGRVVKEVTDESLDKVLAGSKAAAVLLATMDYHLSNDGDVLTVTMHASLFPNTDALKALVAKHDSTKIKTDVRNSLYRNFLVFEAKAAPAQDRDAYIAAWSADHGALMRKVMKLAAVKLSQMLVADLQREPGAPDNGKGSALIDGSTGEVVGQDGDGSQMRFGDGTLKFVLKQAS
jgi:hypothetical protein